jgi:pyrrolysyl-tRNA synthetase-like protein
MARENRPRFASDWNSCILTDKKTKKQPARRYYRKRIEIFRLIEKIKLWPSRRGLLHGIRTVDVIGDQARITTHCNKTFLITNSRNSRAARWLRNKWFKGPVVFAVFPTGNWRNIRPPISSATMALRYRTVQRKT